jgi:hypothetical protein
LQQTIKINAFYIYINLNNFFCRTEGSSKVALATRPLTPVEINKQKKSPVKVKKLIVCFFNTSINNQAYIDCLKIKI